MRNILTFWMLVLSITFYLKAENDIKKAFENGRIVGGTFVYCKMFMSYDDQGSFLKGYDLNKVQTLRNKCDAFLKEYGK